MQQLEQPSGPELFLAAEKALHELGRHDYYPGATHEPPPGPPTLWITHKELKAFEKAFHRLRREHEKAMKDVGEFKAEARRLREAVDDRNRKLTVCKKMFDRVLQDRRVMEQQLKAGKTYIQKLEYRLSRDAHGKGMADRLLEVKDRFSAAQERINELTRVVESQTADLERASREIKTLRKALDVRFDGSDDGSRELVRELAERKVEAQSLASELADKDDRVSTLLNQLHAAREEADEERLAREKAEANCTHLTRQAMEGAQAASTLQARVDQLETENAGLIKALEDKSGKCLTLEKILGTLREDADKAGRELRSRTELFSTREADLTQQLTDLSDKLSKRAAVQALTEEKLAEERRRVKIVTDSLLDKDARLSDLEFEKRALCEEVETLRVRVQEMNQRLSRDDQYMATLRDTRSELESSLRHKGEVEEAMKKEMHELLQDLQRVTGERDRALEGLQQMASQHARQGSSSEQLDRLAAEHQAEMQRLQDKKGLMQKAMLEELAVARERLSQETNRRLQLERELADLQQRELASPAPPHKQRKSSEVRLYDRESDQAPPFEMEDDAQVLGVLAGEGLAMIGDRLATLGDKRVPIAWGEGGEGSFSDLHSAPARPLPPYPETSGSSPPPSSARRRSQPGKEPVTVQVCGLEVTGLPPHEPATLTLNIQEQDRSVVLVPNGGSRRSLPSPIEFTSHPRILRKPLEFTLDGPQGIVRFESVLTQELVKSGRFELQVGTSASGSGSGAAPYPGCTITGVASVLP